MTIKEKTKKAVLTITGLNNPGGHDFSVVIGRLLSEIKNPDRFEKIAIEFYKEHFTDN
ncbi:MAG: hypothetical protein GY804_03685 [Alphaproteobacteria bacterium]|nr:hypothetical protein [Alphaproteobacteria bacterium]